MLLSQSGTTKGLYDIYLMDADGQNTRRAFDALDYRTAPTWSPDGKKIAYHTYSSVPDWAVYRNTIDGGEGERVAETTVKRGGFPAWSPDGTEIAFTDVVAGPPVRVAPLAVRIPTEMRIWIINLQTREKEILLPRIKGGDTHYPAWSPDGTKLAFYWWKRDEKKGWYLYCQSRW